MFPARQYVWNGQVLDADEPRARPVRLRDFTLALARELRWETPMLPLRDGLMLVRAA